VYYPRRVNSIYFDTRDFEFFNQNSAGVEIRTKMRIRWYDNVERELSTIVHNPNFEIKAKKGLLGKKQIRPMSSFVMGQNTSEILHKSNLDDISIVRVSLLIPTVVVSYKRKYFESFDKKVRATIDYDMTFYKTDKNMVVKDKVKVPDTILELKYDHMWNDIVSEISNSFPFRMTKYSKYCNAVEAFYGGIYKE
jgi:SPX domain protein involved in polyphosphate accumulation